MAKIARVVAQLSFRRLFATGFQIAAKSAAPERK
jgi:hypothetical protein